MKTCIYILSVLVTVLIYSCKQEMSEQLPVIDPGSDNKSFTYTNKVSGFYLGNTHDENQSGHDGWTVNEYHYLKDYRLYLENMILVRDSVTEVLYYPHQLLRRYAGNITESFSLLDSLNAIIWQFDLPDAASDLSFQPVLHGSDTRSDLLSAENPLKIFTPAELGASESSGNVLSMGLCYFRESGNNVIIIATLEKDAARISDAIQNIHTNLDALIKQRQDRITNFLLINDAFTNIPEISAAVSWAQISLDALVTEQRGKGIWAGLPWFNNYWGRDTFISFNGALLCPGNFKDARDILLSFARYQLTNEQDDWYGRIPNHITNNEIIYNTADGTWWFIRGVYDYLLYSGDIDFVREIFPVVQRAIQGALRYRIDRYFFLLHGDAETWMDAKSPRGAWSPRGNRAVEIQALWYTALRIGALLARMNGEDALFEHWTAIAESLRKNFLNAYWNDYKYKMYDHLKADDSRDNKIRPNQIFTATASELPGIESLLDTEIQARVINEVTQKLTYRYGVASLWQEDRYFHPWHHYQPYHVQDEAYHNGIVWTWLAGPVISGLCKFGYQDLAFNLFLNESRQILDLDAIVNYSELLDALPRPGKAEPRISGTVSQAWSLAEFTRNFYQDFLGFRPNALAGIATFRPSLPKDISYVSAWLPFASTKIHFNYINQDDEIYFRFNIPDIQDSVKIFLDFPGFEEIYFLLDKDEPDFEFSLLSANRRKYTRFTQLDWHFAHPELPEDLPVLQNLDFNTLGD